MSIAAISIRDKGDDSRLLAEHVQLIAGKGVDGRPAFPLFDSDGNLLISGASAVGARRTVTIESKSENFSTLIDAKIIGLIFSSDFVGTVGGVAYTGAADASESFEAPAGDTLDVIAVVVSAGSVRLKTIA